MWFGGGRRGRGDVEGRGARGRGDKLCLRSSARENWGVMQNLTKERGGGKAVGTPAYGGQGNAVNLGGDQNRTTL